jgi:hypothetical protein
MFAFAWIRVPSPMPLEACELRTVVIVMFVCELACDSNLLSATLGREGPRPASPALQLLLPHSGPPTPRAGARTPHLGSSVDCIAPPTSSPRYRMK